MVRSYQWKETYWFRFNFSIDQQHLGNVMRVERVDSQAVKDKFASLKNTKGKVSAKDCNGWFLFWKVVYLKRREEERKRLEEEQKYIW